MEIFEENESAQQNYSSGFLCSSDFRKAYLTKKATPLQVKTIFFKKKIFIHTHINFKFFFSNERYAKFLLEN